MTPCAVKNQMVVLGQGLAPLSRARSIAWPSDDPAKIRAFPEFSNPRPHQIEAGSDLFLMPSLGEPCGLNQLYNLGARHGPPWCGRPAAWSIPSSTSRRKASRTARRPGSSSKDPTLPGSLRAAIDRALALFGPRPKNLDLKSPPRRECSPTGPGTAAAREYVRLYEEVQRRALQTDIPGSWRVR